jgi:hypothetical protein
MPRTVAEATSGSRKALRLDLLAQLPNLSVPSEGPIDQRV